MVSRREVLQLGKACLVIAGPLRLLGNDSGRRGSQDGLSRQAFNAVLSSGFNTQDQKGNPIVLVLTAVLDPMPVVSAPGTPELDTFLLQFYAASDPLPQGTYNLQHPILGSFPLFIVPSGGSTYTAVINRLKTPLPPAYSIPQRAPKRDVPAAAGIRPASLLETPIVQTAVVKG